MKKVIFTAAFAIVACFGSLTSCSSDNEKNANDTQSAENVMGESFETTANYRFFNPDSVHRAYALSKEIFEKNQKAMVELEKFKQSKTNEINNLGYTIENKRNSGGYLSQTSYEADVKDLQRRSLEAERILSARQNKLQEEMLADDMRLNDSIMNFIKDYNAVKKYDAIISSTSALYYNPSLDITAEIIEGLNARYKDAPAKTETKTETAPVPGAAK